MNLLYNGSHFFFKEELHWYIDFSLWQVYNVQKYVPSFILTQFYIKNIFRQKKIAIDLIAFNVSIGMR